MGHFGKEGKVETVCYNVWKGKKKTHFVENQTCWRPKLVLNFLWVVSSVDAVFFPIPGILFRVPTAVQTELSNFQIVHALRNENLFLPLISIG